MLALQRNSSMKEYLSSLGEKEARDVRLASAWL